MTIGETILLVVFIILCMLHYIGNKLTKENNKLHKEMIQKLDKSNELKMKTHRDIKIVAKYARSKDPDGRYF